LIFITLSHSSSVAVSIPEVGNIPALFTKTSTFPHFSTTLSTTFFQSSDLETSSLKAIA